MSVKVLRNITKMSLLKQFKSWWYKPSEEIYIRFNTKNSGPDDPMVWRVFVNDEERLASSVDIYGWVYDKVTYENGVKKLNIACTGRIHWNGTRVEIQAGKRPDILQ